MTNTSAYLGLLRLRSVQVARHKSLSTSDKYFGLPRLTSTSLSTSRSAQVAQYK
ncbi:hypothetical protein LC613_17280 [Nostoc sphaeroides CHAB 2801]|uniref:hypothetical protein n=1 Tax=Nostoc sphaeroides TaxID=446679 RepID=UPI0015F34859|nr:hypothetical protein [Nostoc sphaeroides]MCC5629709.1 hypothetical protein [Nostoc sphaeroides CHAB 2801]